MLNQDGQKQELGSANTKRVWIDHQFKTTCLIVGLALIGLVSCGGPGQPICTLMAAHLAHDDGRTSCFDPIVSTPASCVGISAAQCAADLYASPVAPTVAPDNYQLEFLSRCEDGSSACTFAEEVRCIDGSRPAFYFHPGDSDEWIFYIGGEGGPCSAANAPGECFDRITQGSTDPHAASLTSRWAPNYTDRGGMLSVNPAANPLHHYNKIVFEKCHVGESGQGVLLDFGTNAAGVTFGYLEFHQGRRIWHTLFNYLALNSVALGLNDFNQASQILLAGHSDQGKGMIYSGDALRDYLELNLFEEASPDIRLAIDGHVVPSLEGEFAVGNNVCPADANGNGRDDFYDACTWSGTLPPNDPVFGDDGFSITPFVSGRSWTRNNSHGAILDESCELMHGADAPECHDQMHTMMNHLGTPFFARMDIRDIVLIDENSPPHSDSPVTYFLPAASFKERVRQTVQDLLEFGVVNAEEPMLYNPAFYVPSAGGSGSHTGLSQSSPYNATLLQECVNAAPVGSPVSTADFLSGWLLDDPVLGVYQALHGKKCVTDNVTWASSAAACICP
jgi:hypothetical protein